MKCSAIPNFLLISRILDIELYILLFLYQFPGNIHEQAGAELGQAQLKVELKPGLLYKRFVRSN